MVEFEIDGTFILLIGLIVLIIVGVAYVQGADFIDGIINNPNRPTNYYDVTCDTVIENVLAIGGVRFLDKFNGESYPQCTFSKSSLFSLGSFSLFDTGNVRMSAQGKTTFARFNLLEGSRDDVTLKLKRIEAGQVQINLATLDDDGRVIDTQTLTMTVGD